MEEIIARIKEYVLVIDSTLSGENAALLDLIINDVVDRALIFMNRNQLVDKYESDLEDETILEADYVLPIPKALERALAGTVVKVLKTVKEQNLSSLGAITSISDNGQSISYSSKAVSFLASSNDSEIFSGVSGLMRRFILPTIPKNENSGYIQRTNSGQFL